MHQRIDDAELMYASMLREGFEGVPRDTGLALQHIRQLADRKNPEALYILALEAIKADRKVEAVRLMTLSADYGFSHAQYQLGLGVAQHDLGCMYMEGTVPDVPCNFSLGFEYWLMAAEGGFPISQINVGKAYMNGLSISGEGGGAIEQDWVRARIYFEK
eukprot:jgi/Hompol1/3091/HPOL_006357-RA